MATGLPASIRQLFCWHAAPIIGIMTAASLTTYFTSRVCARERETPGQPSGERTSYEKPSKPPRADTHCDNTVSNDREGFVGRIGTKYDPAAGFFVGSPRTGPHVGIAGGCGGFFQRWRSSESGDGTDGKAGARTIGGPLWTGGGSGSRRLQRGAMVIGILIGAAALPSVLTPDSIGFSAGSESRARGFHRSLRIVDTN